MTFFFSVSSVGFSALKARHYIAQGKALGLKGGGLPQTQHSMLGYLSRRSYLSEGG